MSNNMPNEVVAIAMALSLYFSDLSTTTKAMCLQSSVTTLLGVIKFIK